MAGKVKLVHLVSCAVASLPNIHVWGISGADNLWNHVFHLLIVYVAVLCCSLLLASGFAVVIEKIMKIHWITSQIIPKKTNKKQKKNKRERKRKKNCVDCWGMQREWTAHTNKDTFFNTNKPNPSASILTIWKACGCLVLGKISWQCHVSRMFRLPGFPSSPVRCHLGVKSPFCIPGNPCFLLLLLSFGYQGWRQPTRPSMSPPLFGEILFGNSNDCFPSTIDNENLQNLCL